MPIFVESLLNEVRNSYQSLNVEGLHELLDLCAEFHNIPSTRQVLSTILQAMAENKLKKYQFSFFSLLSLPENHSLFLKLMRLKIFQDLEGKNLIPLLSLTQRWEIKEGLESQSELWQLCQTEEGLSALHEIIQHDEKLFGKIVFQKLSPFLIRQHNYLSSFVLKIYSLERYYIFIALIGHADLKNMAHVSFVKLLLTHFADIVQGSSLLCLTQPYENNFLTVMAMLINVFYCFFNKQFDINEVFNADVMNKPKEGIQELNEMIYSISWMIFKETLICAGINDVNKLTELVELFLEISSNYRINITYFSEYSLASDVLLETFGSYMGFMRLCVEYSKLREAQFTAVNMCKLYKEFFALIHGFLKPGCSLSLSKEVAIDIIFATGNDFIRKHKEVFISRNACQFFHGVDSETSKNPSPMRGVNVV